MNSNNESDKMYPATDLADFHRVMTEGWNPAKPPPDRKIWTNRQVVGMRRAMVLRMAQTGNPVAKLQGEAQFIMEMVNPALVAQDTPEMVRSRVLIGGPVSDLEATQQMHYYFMQAACDLAGELDLPFMHGDFAENIATVINKLWAIRQAADRVGMRYDHYIVKHVERGRARGKRKFIWSDFITKRKRRTK